MSHRIFDFPRPVKCLFCNAADFVQQLADLDFQAVPAFLNAIENIVLYARAVNFQKVPQKFSSLVRDYFACHPQAAKRRQRASAAAMGVAQFR